MANTYLCPACGATTSAQATHCKGCGQEIPPGGGVRETLFELDQPASSKWHWGWVFGGAAIILAIQALSGLVVIPGLLLGAMVVGPGILLLYLIAVAVLTYFGGGLLIGRLSKGYTVKEPAVAGVIAAVVNWLLEYFLFQNTDLGIGVLAAAAALCALLAALGGSAGETLQQRSEQRKRDRLRAQKPPA